jgi:hypothetical protein
MKSNRSMNTWAIFPIGQTKRMEENPTQRDTVIPARRLPRKVRLRISIAFLAVFAFLAIGMFLLALQGFAPMMLKD